MHPPQALGPPAVMIYLELSLSATAMAICAGTLLAALAAWGTFKSSDVPPVRLSPPSKPKQVYCWLLDWDCKHPKRKRMEYAILYTRSSVGLGRERCGRGESKWAMRIWSLTP